MSDFFEVRGAGDFDRFAKALKAAGRTDLRKEMFKAFRAAAKPLIAASRQEARRRLPSSGGLAEQVAKEPQRVQIRTGRHAGVRIAVGKKRGGARTANRGVVRHPVFGNRKVWVSQKVTPGWFDDPMREGAPLVRRKLEQAIENVADRVVKETR